MWRFLFVYLYIYSFIYSSVLYFYGVVFVVIIYPSPSLGQDMTQGHFLKRLTGLNSQFSFSLNSCLTKAAKPSLPYYLPIAGGRIIGFIPFPRVLVLCEMQLVSFRIWTRVAVPISYDDNHYTTGTICYLFICFLSGKVCRYPFISKFC